ncbi:proline-rich protein, Y-linked-like isoform X2 [Callithrix jacchus]
MSRGTELYGLKYMGPLNLWLLFGFEGQKVADEKDQGCVCIPFCHDSKFPEASVALQNWTWMNLETLILSKLTHEQKTKHYMFSLTAPCSAMSHW